MYVLRAIGAARAHGWIDPRSRARCLRKLVLSAEGKAYPWFGRVSKVVIDYQEPTDATGMRQQPGRPIYGESAGAAVGATLTCISRTP